MYNVYVIGVCVCMCVCVRVPPDAMEMCARADTMDGDDNAAPALESLGLHPGVLGSPPLQNQDQARKWQCEMTRNDHGSHHQNFPTSATSVGSGWDRACCHHNHHRETNITKTSIAITTSPCVPQT